MSKKRLTHFKKVDPLLYELALKLEIEDLEQSDNYFSKLCNEIVGQQLSGKVVDTIFERFRNLFKDRVINAEELYTMSEDTLRSAGMAYSKARALRDLAKKILDGEVELEKFDELEDERVREELIRVKGIGPWTAEMFLIFTLRREDVFSPLDLGLRKGIQRLDKLEKLPTPKEAEERARVWSPFRSYASRLLWASLDLKI